MSERPLRISVIMPAYNAENYIAEAVRSVLEQPVEDLELIVVNNGSTDKTSHIVRSFDDPRVRLLEFDKLGPASARNVGLAHAIGKYITFLDADDIYYPDTLQKFLDEFERDKGLRAVYGGHPQYCGPDMKPLPTSFRRIDVTDEQVAFANRYPVAALFDNAINSQLSSIMIHCDVLPQVGMFDSHLSVGEDFEWMLRLFRIAPPKIVLDRFVIQYRCNPDSMMRSRRTVRKRIQGSRHIIGLIRGHDFGNAELNEKRGYYAARKWLDLCDNVTGKDFRLLSRCLLKRYFTDAALPKKYFAKRILKLSLKVLALSVTLPGRKPKAAQLKALQPGACM